MKKFSKFLVLSLILLPLMSACGLFGENDHVRYIAVKMSDSKDVWSIVDTKDGSVIADDEYSSKPSVVNNDMYYVKNDKGLYEFYNVNDKNHNVGIGFKSATFFQNGLAVVCKEGEELSIMNKDGEMVAKLSSSIKAASVFKNGMSIVMNEENKVGFINTDGELVIKMSYDGFVMPFSEDGYAVVFKNDDNDEHTKTFMVIDKKGERLFSFNSGKYEAVLSEFVNGAIAVKAGDEIVYLDETGNKMLKVGEYKDGVYGLYKGLTVYADGNEFGIKNKDGEKTVRAKYGALVPIKNGDFMAKKDDKWFIINEKGEKLTSDDYESICRLNDDRYMIQTKSGGNFSIIDEKGNEIGRDSYADFSLDGNAFAVSDEGNKKSADVEAPAEAEAPSAAADSVEKVEEATKASVYDSSSMKLTGTVAGAAVIMYLDNDDGSLSGYYYYSKMGPNNALKLNGTLDNGTIELNEYNSRNGVNSGYFSGYLSSDGSMSGKFYNSKGRESNFRLRAVDY